MDREDTIKMLVKIATDGYSNNIDLGRFGLTKTAQEMNEACEDKELVRVALLRSPYATDPDFEGLAGAMVLFP